MSYIDTGRARRARSILKEEDEEVISELMLAELASIATRR